MNTINVAVNNPGFMLVFFGSAVLCLAATAVSILQWLPIGGTPEAAASWTRYLEEWMRWNTVRTVASTVAAILFTARLAAGS